MGFHLRREKVELAIFFASRGYEPVLLKGSDVMLCHSIVNVKGLGKPVDVIGFVPQQGENTSSVWASPGPCKNVPQEPFPRSVGCRGRESQVSSFQGVALLMVLCSGIKA